MSYDDSPPKRLRMSKKKKSGGKSSTFQPVLFDRKSSVWIECIFFKVMAVNGCREARALGYTERKMK